MARSLFPPWLRRALEVAIGAAVVAIVTLAGDRLGQGTTPYPLPAGPAGALLLAPPVMVLGVLPIAYPIAMAATRADAVMGAIAGWLLAVDLTILFSGGHVALERVAVTLPTGALVGLLALGPAIVGIVGSQLGTALGFGRRAGAIAAVGSAIAALFALVLVNLAA